MITTAFTPTQIHLLQMFQFNRNEEDLIELKEVLHEHYAKKMDTRLNSLWDDGTLDKKRLDEINDMDLHAWLREQKAQEQQLN
ncbi:MAG: hypothetical protein J5900_04205 [Prevotella sp.]|nr:hypothetical protein [Prevotella sp.]